MGNSYKQLLGDFRPIGAHVDGTTISSAVVLTPPGGETKIMLQATAQNIRYTIDGTTPTATTGFQLLSTDGPIVIGLGKGMILTVIEETATADIQYQWGD